jgi:hypothetical protein
VFGVAVGFGTSVGTGAGVRVTVDGNSVGVTVGVTVGVAVGVTVSVSVGVTVGVIVSVGVTVSVTVIVGDGTYAASVAAAFWVSSNRCTVATAGMIVAVGTNLLGGGVAVARDRRSSVGGTAPNRVAVAIAVAVSGGVGVQITGVEVFVAVGSARGSYTRNRIDPRTSDPSPFTTPAPISTVYPAGAVRGAITNMHVSPVPGAGVQRPITASTTVPTVVVVRGFNHCNSDRSFGGPLPSTTRIVQFVPIEAPSGTGDPSVVVKRARRTMNGSPGASDASDGDTATDATVGTPWALAAPGRNAAATDTKRPRANAGRTVHPKRVRRNPRGRRVESTAGRGVERRGMVVDGKTVSVGPRCVRRQITSDCCENDNAPTVSGGGAWPRARNRDVATTWRSAWNR